MFPPQSLLIFKKTSFFVKKNIMPPHLPPWSPTRRSPWSVGRFSVYVLCVAAACEVNSGGLPKFDGTKRFGSNTTRGAPLQRAPRVGSQGRLSAFMISLHEKKCSLSVLANVDLILTYKGNYQIGLCFFCVGKWHLCCLINQIFSGVKENTCLFVSLLLGFVWDVRLLDLVLDMVLFFLR